MLQIHLAGVRLRFRRNRLKCYTHPERDAVGTCKHCHKGICPACAKESGFGLVCSGPCEQEMLGLKASMERNRKMLPLGAKAHVRNAIWLLLMAAIFIGFALTQREGGFAIFLIALGAVMLLGAAFSFFNSRRLKKLQG